MKIAILYDLCYPETIGGAEKRFAKLAQHLALLGHDVHYVTTKVWEGEDSLLRDGYTLHGVCRADVIQDGYSRRTALSIIRYSVGAASFVASHDFDVVDCCNFPYLPMVLARMTCTLRRTPFCTTWLEFTGSYWSKLVPHPWWKLISFGESLIAATCQNVIAISEHTLRRIIHNRRTKPARSIVISSGIDETLSTPTVDMQDTFIFVGRLRAHKRPFLLLEAAALLQQRGRAYGFVFVGTGPELPKLQSYAAESGLGPAITFISHCEQAELQRHLQGARALVLPSEREGLSLVAIEALTLGVPVITTDDPSNAAVDLITHGVTGLIVEPKAEALAEALVEIVETPRENFQEACKKKSEEFDWRCQSRRLSEFYRALQS